MKDKEFDQSIISVEHNYFPTILSSKTSSIIEKDVFDEFSLERFCPRNFVHDLQKPIQFLQCFTIELEENDTNFNTPAQFNY